MFPSRYGFTRARGRVRTSAGRRHVEKNGRPGEPYVFLKSESRILVVTPGMDGTLSITAPRPHARDGKELAAIGAKVDGTLSVSVPKGMTVVRHNATSTPSLLGLIGGHCWRIRSPEENATIVIRTGR